ncbi:MAG: hypothetical protein KDE20_29585, partial [Caldilineaceae bacterium]|nr:hypothetical protein [Caldilineaceae bacterium]
EFIEITGTLLSLFVWTVFGANIVMASVVFLLMAFEAYHHEGLHPDALVAAAGWTILLSVFLHGMSAQPLADWYARRLADASPASPEFLDSPDVLVRRHV